MPLRSCILKKRLLVKTASLLLFLFSGNYPVMAQLRPQMYYSDSGVVGRPIAKDPKVIYFKDRYLMYYSLPGQNNSSWSIGIAESSDGVHWTKAGTLQPAADYEKNGLCAPGALIKDGKVQLFYQTYGNGAKDAICHAVSEDGIHFIRNKTNPVFHPSGNWTCGRAIDAEVVAFKNRYFLYFATRDTAFKIQMQGVAATADLNSSFDRGQWQQLGNGPILKPELPWEKNCIEAASCIVIDNELYMFYAGGYNNEPQQIGLAKSADGLHWKRVSAQPFLSNGQPGTWNESESGHPDIFRAPDNSYYLYFQGNNNKGRSWYLSRKPLVYNKAWRIARSNH